MPISYEKLLNIFKKKGITSYSITKKDKILGQATWKKIHENGHIDSKRYKTHRNEKKCML